jgi:hypothetical protein
VRSRSALRLHFDPTGDVLAGARECEAEVFLRAYGNTRDEIADEYGPYEDSSVFIALTDESDEVVAETRLIGPSSAGLKTLNDVSRAPWHVDGVRSARAVGVDPQRTWDVATIGISSKLRGRGLPAATAMYHGIVAGIRANDLRWVVMLMDERARRLLSALDCETFVLPGTWAGDYMGSNACTPLWADVQTMMDVQRQRNPEAHRLVGLGAGLEGISLPGPDGFVVRPRRNVPAIAPELEPALLESA